MIEADLSRRRRGELVDKLAATYILQGALDAATNIARLINPKSEKP
jgi:putative Holliday junction resolvase